MKVIDDAIKLGACSKVKNIDSLKKAVSLFFSPQGREFCLKHNYPSIDIFRSLGDLSEYNVFVDNNNVNKIDEDIALINSHGELEFTEGYHKVILMHGSTANIKVGEACRVTVEGEGAKIW